MKKFWPFSFYFLYYAAFSSLLPFIVLFYQQLDFTGTQIGLLTGIPPLLTLIAAPFWTSIADATRRHRLVMSLSLGVALVSIWILQSMTTFIVIFIIILIYNFFFSPAGSLADSATIAMLVQNGAATNVNRGGRPVNNPICVPVKFNC